MLPNSFNDQINKQTKDIKIIDLFIFLLKYKWLILFSVLFAGIATPLYVSVLKDPAAMPPKIYFSQCSVAAYGDSASSSSREENFKFMLQSYDLTLLEAKENRLPMIRHIIWDTRDNKWVTERIYIWDERSGTLIAEQPGNKVVPEETATLHLKIQNGVLTIRFSSDEKEKTIKFMGICLDYISNFYRHRDIAIYKAQQKMYQEQLLKAKDPFIKDRLLENLIAVNFRELRARNDRYYGFDVMDSPSITEVNSQKQIVKGPSKKRYLMMTLLLMMAAFVIALTIAGAIEYMSLIKKKDPEGFAVLLKHLRLKNRSSRPVDPN